MICRLRMVVGETDHQGMDRALLTLQAQLVEAPAAAAAAPGCGTEGEVCLLRCCSHA
jgi:hypothetical protein